MHLGWLLCLLLVLHLLCLHLLLLSRVGKIWGHLLQVCSLPLLMHCD